MCAQGHHPFDPDQCPMLQGLSPQEQQFRMRTDPMIRACIETHCVVTAPPTNAAPANKPRKRASARKAVSKNATAAACCQMPTSGT